MNKYFGALKSIACVIVFCVTYLSVCIAETSGDIRTPAIAKSASERIYIYNQHNGSETDQAWAKKALAGGNDLMHAGCHIYAYAHAIQWLTEYGRIDGKLQICDVEYPSVYPVENHGWRVQGGYIASHSRLIAIQSQIVDSEGKVLSDSGVMSINGYRYAVQALESVSTHDNGVRFSRISSAGEYQWILSAEDASGAKIVMTMPISVVYHGMLKTESMSFSTEDLEVEDIPTDGEP